MNTSSTSSTQKGKRPYTLKRHFTNDRPKRKLFGIVQVPSEVDMRSRVPLIWDQKQLGSCTVNALLQAMQFLVPKVIFSRLFLYWQERNIDKDINEDAGSTFSTGIQALTETGCCQEVTWPYIQEKFKEKPPETAFGEAKLYRLKEAEHVDCTELSIKQCLAAGYPIAIGIAIHQSFESDQVQKTGHVPLPDPDESKDPHLGDHAVLMVGYKDSTKEFIMLNSWSDQWGDKGFFYLPYEFITAQNGKYVASDLWKLEFVVDQGPALPLPTIKEDEKQTTTSTATDNTTSGPFVDPYVMGPVSTPPAEEKGQEQEVTQVVTTISKSNIFKDCLICTATCCEFLGELCYSCCKSTCWCLCCCGCCQCCRNKCKSKKSLGGGHTAVVVKKARPSARESARV